MRHRGKRGGKEGKGEQGFDGEREEEAGKIKEARKNGLKLTSEA